MSERRGGSEGRRPRKGDRRVCITCHKKYVTLSLLGSNLRLSWFVLTNISINPHALGFVFNFSRGLVTNQDRLSLTWSFYAPYNRSFIYHPDLCLSWDFLRVSDKIYEETGLN